MQGPTDIGRFKSAAAPEDSGDSAAVGPVTMVNIPDHELLRPIGRGSYGEVWLGRTVIGTYRAVKIIHAGSFKDNRPFEREYEGIRNFEPVSRSHEGLVDILHVGRLEAEGVIFYVMELADDLQTGQEIDPAHYTPRTLTSSVGPSKRLPVEECIKFGMVLTSALAHLHRYSLLHRDIKPSNIIFVHGVPKLADIGLVTEMEGARSYVGTEGFIPPEGPKSAQADIFSLGKVLYEVSTGKDRLQFPELPGELDDSEASRQLLEFNEILLRACHPDPANRYASADEMHAELAVLGVGKSVRRLRFLERQLALVKRAGLTGGLLLLVFALAYFGVYRQRREVAEMLQRQVGAHLANASAFMEQGDLLGAVPLLVRALDLDRGDSAREEAQRRRLGCVLAQCPTVTHMWFSGRKISSLEFSRSGDRLLATGWRDRAMEWNIETDRAPDGCLLFGEGLLQSSFSPDGHSVATACEHGDVQVWDAGAATARLSLRNPSGFSSSRWSPDGRRLVTGSFDGRAQIWDTGTGNLLLTLTNHSQAVLDASFSPDGRLVATCGHDATAYVYDASTGRGLSPPLRHGGWVYRVAFSPDGQRLATACSDRRARLWKLPSYEEIPALLKHGDIVSGVAFSPDGRYLATSSLDATVRLWEAATGLPTMNNPILRHAARATDAVFAPDGHRLATACIDGVVRIWDLAASQLVPSRLPGTLSLDGTRYVELTSKGARVGRVQSALTQPLFTLEQEGISEALLNSEGTFLATLSRKSVGEQGLLKIWNIDSGTLASVATQWTNCLSNTTISGHGRHVALLEDQTVHLFTLPEMSGPLPQLKHCAKVEWAQFDADDQRLLTVSSNSVFIWNVETGQLAIPPLVHPTLVAYASFSPRGDLLVTCARDNSLSECAAQLWDARTGRRVGLPLNHGDGVLFAAFSPDAKRVVTTSEDFTALVWEVPSGRRVTPPLRHEHQVTSAVFSADRRWLATTSWDFTVRLWDAETGDLFDAAIDQPDYAARAAFVDNGRSLVCIRPDGQGWSWDLPKQEGDADLASIAWVLCGGPGDARMEGPQARQLALRAAWDRFRGLRGKPLRATEAQIAAWDRAEADRDERKELWFPALFHVERLLELAPGERSLLERRAALARKLEPTPPPNTSGSRLAPR